MRCLSLYPSAPRESAKSARASLLLRIEKIDHTHGPLWNFTQQTENAGYCKLVGWTGGLHCLGRASAGVAVGITSRTVNHSTGDEAPEKIPPGRPATLADCSNLRLRRCAGESVEIAWRCPSLPGIAQLQMNDHKGKCQTVPGQTSGLGQTSRGPAHESVKKRLALPIARAHAKSATYEKPARAQRQM